jgi:hypothetical protein
LNIEKIISMARKPKFNRYLSFSEIKNKFSWGVLNGSYNEAWEGC